ncbi:hypothetical protein HC166_09675 [Aeromonas media]
MEDFINTLFQLMAGSLQSLDYTCISTRANTQMSEPLAAVKEMNKMTGLGMPARQLLE